jgi:hypothetical protein
MAGKWLPAALFAVGLAACDESPISLPQPTSIAAPAAELRLTVGDAVTLPNQVLDQNGRPIRGLQPGFASDNPSVASVDGAGNVRAVSPGTANITSSYGSVTATTKVTVTRDERNFVSTLDLSADSVVTDVRGGPQVLSIRAFNGFGQQVCPAVTVRVHDQSVADVAADAGCRLTITPRFPGRTAVTVTADGNSDTFTLVVNSTGAVAFFSARPATAELVAGNTVSYGVRVLDEQGIPVPNRTVNFDVSAGRLLATRAITNAEGVATVQWVLPTNLRDLSHYHGIRFSTQLPNGEVVARNEEAFINGGPVVTLTLLRESLDGGPRYVPFTGTSITVGTSETVYLGARAEDQYGNPRATDIIFSVPAPAYLACGDFPGGGFAVEATCIATFGAGTFTFTATVPASGPTPALTKTLAVTFVQGR